MNRNFAFGPYYLSIAATSANATLRRGKHDCADLTAQDCMRPNSGFLSNSALSKRCLIKGKPPFLGAFNRAFRRNFSARLSIHDHFRCSIGWRGCDTGAHNE